MNIQKCVFSALIIFHSLLSAKTERWNVKTSYQNIIENAQSGSAYYQGLLGIYLRSGEGGSSVNIELSRKWSNVAVKQDHPFGAYNLANLAMLKGDLVAATRLYQDAALRLQRYASDGDPVAMYCMGEIDFQVIPTNVTRALGLFMRSAELGYPQAQATIGALYLRGLPGLLDRNTEKGISLLSKAVRAKSLTARFNLGMAYYNGDGVEKNAYKASQWLRLAVKQNFSEAQYSLGLLLLDGGDGINKNTTEGLKLLQDAAAQNHQLAKKYLQKRGTPPKQTTNSVDSSLDLDLGQDQPILDDLERMDQARKYYTGVGVTRNYDKAYKLFFPLAQGGNAEAARFIGLMKLGGKGTDKNLKLAKEWLSVASQKGDKISQKLLSSYKSLF
jgi:hypothetical protein